MEMLQRPKPEDLLNQIQKDEEKKGRGKLKIFFGYAAGVGKTYAMLKSARKLKKDGIDVVCGYIEPHSRPDTIKLLDGLDMMPLLNIIHNGISLNEMDIDLILVRKPQVVLVDEYAHTNAKGCRHEKRYQDVEELLDAGIDVYTTVNVQHIESLCDIVSSITGVIVRERIPDKAFDLADEVQLVDIEPSELMRRLQEGKVYSRKQAKRALNNFFTGEKLIALRELALRRTADRVNIISEKAKKISGNEYFTEEKILVGLSSSPSNPKIIRAASRMAQAFGGIFVGVFVETPTAENMSLENKKRLNDNIHLAEQLGAKIETICGEDIPFLLAEYAKSSGISKIVVGRSNAKKTIFSKASFAERLSMLAPNLDIYIIPDSNLQQMKKSLKKPDYEKLTWKDFGKVLSILAVTTIIGMIFHNYGFSDTNIITVYILGVMISGILVSNRIFTLGLSVLCILSFNYLFTVPRYTLRTYDKGYPVTFIITFLAAFISSNLAFRMKVQAKDLAKVAMRTKVLLDTNQLLQDEKDIDGICKIVSLQLSKLLSRDIVFYQGSEGKLLNPIVTYVQTDVKPKNTMCKYTSESEKAVAEWVYKNRKRAGASTSTLCSAKCYYLAIRNIDNVYGVIGISMNHNESLEAFESNLLFAILSETATAMEREVLRIQQEKATEQANSEKLRANLLRAISHDLRTPLTTISGNADMLLKNELSEDIRKKIYTDMYDDSMWLINLVENLLSVTRLEDGSLKINTHPELVEEIIKEGLKHISRHSEEYDIILNIEDEMQLVSVDSKLIVQVIINLVDNAIKYTPSGSTICISTKKEGSMVVTQVTDNGNGINKQDQEKIFDMFYTANSEIADSKRSLGLGLALCKSIINAHGGEIKVSDNIPRGAVFSFTLKAEEVVINE